MPGIRQMRWLSLGTLLIVGAVVGCERAEPGRGETRTKNSATRTPLDPPPSANAPDAASTNANATAHSDDSSPASRGPRAYDAAAAPEEVELVPLSGGGGLRVVSSVELSRYMGKWYEIARYPNSFQSGLVGVIAEYRLRDDGKFDVINTGYKNNLDGPKEQSEAVGWVADEGTRAKLYVRFFWPFKADYWIIELAADYSHAVVGQPGREYLWILSRAPTMSDKLYEAIERRLLQQGYDPKKLQRTKQPADAPIFSVPDV